MKITVVGTGYVGLVTGTCFAETGNHVACVDIDENKVKKLIEGVIPIYEPGLEVLFERNTRQGRLTFTTELREGIKGAEVVFLALPTPSGADGSADLTYILRVAGQLSRLIEQYTVIVDKSTVPVGTAEKVKDVLTQNLDHSLFDVVSNPEFLREGAAVDDFMKPDRVVIGASSERARQIMQMLYEPFVRQGNPLLFMDERSAEMTKYAANAYLATRISFMNEIANLCEKVGANVDMVRAGIGSDSRIGKRFLFPGVGYGGSCFPKDVQALSITASQVSYDFKILYAVMEVNRLQKHILSAKINAYFNNDLKNKTIAIWGLAFKPNTDDIREAPALTIMNDLLNAGASLRVYDPEAMDNVKAYYGDKLYYASDPYETLEGAHALAVVTEWSVFRNPDYALMKKLVQHPAIFDGRNVFLPERLLQLGFDYFSIGRP
ncbi:MAG TPA: UDP-glucose/GDP-mannose dehydrogenase family protein [Saprospiraceae bacterium]|nr:UDP-glucose/GDP-mannose dehydrogenase family protein [Saprospiraceae bacterium]